MIKTSTLSSELKAALRLIQPQKHRRALSRRPDDQLQFAPQIAAVGPGLLLDTTVYIDTLQDRLPLAAEQLLALRTLNHSSIAVGELALAFGTLDPDDVRTAANLSVIEQAIAAISSHRLSAPTDRAILRAGISAGLLARLQGLNPADRRKMFNDAVLFFQAFEQGHWLITRNIADMDLLQQLVPAGRVLFYRH